VKIVQITPYYLPHTGGIERYVYNLSTYLVDHGHTIDIITSDVPSIDKRDDNGSFKIYRYKCIGSPLGNPILIGLSDLHKRLKEYDIIHIHGVYTYLALRAILAFNHQSHQKLILTHHGRTVYPQALKNLLAKTYDNIIVRFILGKIDCGVVLSKADKDHLCSLGLLEEKAHIIPNGIDTQLFHKVDDAHVASFTRAYNLTHKKIVLFLAVVSERKGIFDLIRAFESISIENVHLIVVGDGPDLIKAQTMVLERGLSDSITFTGRLSFQQLLTAYSSSSLYVLPSYREGMPTTIIEALVMGVPVIATRIPGVEDNFSEYATLVEPGDPVELARAIEYVLNNGDTRCKLGASEIAMFDSKHAFEMYSTLYQ